MREDPDFFLLPPPLSFPLSPPFLFSFAIRKPRGRESGGPVESRGGFLFSPLPSVRVSFPPFLFPEDSGGTLRCEKAKRMQSAGHYFFSLLSLSSSSFYKSSFSSPSCFPIRRIFALEKRSRHPRIPPLFFFPFSPFPFLEGPFFSSFLPWARVHSRQGKVSGI